MRKWSFTAFFVLFCVYLPLSSIARRQPKRVKNTEALFSKTLLRERNSKGIQKTSNFRQNFSQSAPMFSVLPHHKFVEPIMKMSGGLQSLQPRLVVAPPRMKMSRRAPRGGWGVRRAPRAVHRSDRCFPRTAVRAFVPQWSFRQRTDAQVDSTCSIVENCALHFWYRNSSKLCKTLYEIP